MRSESSAILFLVPRHKEVWLTPLLECRAVMLAILENAKIGRKVNSAPGKILLGARALENVYIV